LEIVVAASSSEGFSGLAVYPVSVLKQAKCASGDEDRVATTVSANPDDKGVRRILVRTVETDPRRRK